MKPIISVVIPIYNTGIYLRKCLDSLVCQTLEDIEIICIDDVSPDNSSDIVQEYAKKDNRIKLIKHTVNTGQGGARNTGILAAKGEFIASVDSDDFIAPNMLEKLWESSELGEFDVTCCGFIRVTDTNTEITRRVFKSTAVDNSNNAINIFTRANPAIWNKLWRRTLFIDNDIFFPEKLYYQDMATIPLLLSKANKIKFIDDCLYYYLVRDGSVTTTYSPKHIIDYFKVYEVLFASLDRFGLLERYLKELFENISEGMRFHSENVTKSSMNETEINQYLRHMLMLKLSFFELHQPLVKVEQKELLNHLRTATKINQIKNNHQEFSDQETIRVEAGNLSNTKLPAPVITNKLSIFQKTGIKVFAFIFRPFILPKQMKKLNDQPIAFFKDSQNDFTQLCRRLLRLR